MSASKEVDEEYHSTEAESIRWKVNESVNEIELMLASETVTKSTRQYGTERRTKKTRRSSRPHRTQTRRTMRMTESMPQRNHETSIPQEITQKITDSWSVTLTHNQPHKGLALCPRCHPAWWHRRAHWWVPARTPTLHLCPQSGEAVGGPNAPQEDPKHEVFRQASTESDIISLDGGLRLDGILLSMCGI